MYWYQRSSFNWDKDLCRVFSTRIWPSYQIHMGCLVKWPINYVEDLAAIDLTFQSLVKKDVCVIVTSNLEKGVLLAI